MPIQANRHIGPAVQPARYQLLAPDTPDSALWRDPGWWCGGRGMLWKCDKEETKNAVEDHHGDAERFMRRSLEISEKTLGSAHPEVAASRKVFAQVLRTGHRDIEVHRAESQAQDVRARSTRGH